MSDVRQWARENVTTWTEGNFANLFSWLDKGCPVHGIDLDALGLTAEYGHAALAHLREVAEGLTDRLRCGMLAARRPGWKDRASGSLMSQITRLGFTDADHKPTPFGHAVGRYMERQRKDSSE